MGIPSAITAVEGEDDVGCEEVEGEGEERREEKSLPRSG